MTNKMISLTKTLLQLLINFLCLHLIDWKKKPSGADVGKPTYVFPSTLKRVIREIIPGALVDKPDPTHAQVNVISFNYSQ